MNGSKRKKPLPGGRHSKRGKLLLQGGREGGREGRREGRKEGEKGRGRGSEEDEVLKEGRQRMNGKK